MEELNSFEKLGLSEETLEALQKKGFEEPTPIQAKTIPLLLNTDLDIVGQAQTGTGKTAAFGLPIIEKIEEKKQAVQALILTPTRELAIQVSEELSSLKGRRKIHIAPIYGGQSIENQLRILKRGVHIVVGTPGRVRDHLERKSLNLSEVSFVVLDEADEMLNMGFIEEVEDILKQTNPNKRMLLFSATMPERILKLAEDFMKEYQFVSVRKDQITTTLTDQIYFEVEEEDKFEALCRIIDTEKEFYGLIFCRTKVDVDTLCSKLVDRGYDAEGLHGDISQYQREKILSKFKSQRVNILVATDVAARGLDIQDLTHVINYSLPQDPESYVHRIGRTGRAGKEGTAITFVTPEEYRKLLFIKKIAKTDIRKEKLPNIQEVITMKKNRIKDEVYAILEKEEEITDYVEIAKEMLSDKAPEKVLAALLKYSFQDELDEKNYNEIREISIDKKGRTRLFVSLGRLDEMTPKKLVSFIRKETNVDERKIKDVQIFDKFSFITVPFEEAELILSIFKNKGKGRRPLVEKAKDKK